MDARDRWSSGLATTRSELILEAFDRRQESLGRRARGPAGAARPAGGRVGRGARGARARSPRRPPLRSRPPPRARPADATYVAFENRFRGSARRDPRAPADLRRALPRAGPGRRPGLRARRVPGAAAREAASRPRSARSGTRRPRPSAGGRSTWPSRATCSSSFRAPGGGRLGGVFAAQVAEHLPPAVLQPALREAHRALRPGGLLVLETVNPRSVLASSRSTTATSPTSSRCTRRRCRFLAAAAGLHRRPRRDALAGGRGGAPAAGARGRPAARAPRPR